MREIEFIDDQPPPQDGPPRPGRSRSLLLAATVLVVAAATWALTRPGDRVSQLAQPSRPPTPSVSSTHPLPSPPPVENTDDACHGAPFCAPTVNFPQAVTETIRRYLPRATSVDVRTYIAQSLATGGSYLSARDITFVDGHAGVLIRVRRDLGSHAAPSPIVTMPVGPSLLVHGGPAGYLVDVQFVVADPGPDTRGKLRALVADAGLEAL